MKLRLTINSGTLAGHVFDLDSGFISIGRGNNCTVRFDPAGERIASKQHAFIEAKPDGFYITDNNSTNGTLVNGSRVSSQKLESGDTVQFGRNGVTSVVSIEGESFESTPTAPGTFREQQLESFQHMASAAPSGIQNSLVNFGLGHMDAEPPPPPPSRVWPMVLVILAAIILIPIALFSFALIYFSLGIVPAFIATIIAFTPAFIYLFPLLWLDRFDPEPPWLIAMCFVWGGAVAILVSAIVNDLVGMAAFISTGSPDLAMVASAVISAPLIEESTKGIALLILLIGLRRYFDDMLDGIVFAGIIALGFATVENILYYGRGIDEAVQTYGVTSDAAYSFLGLFTLRGILSPWAHVLFTAMIGIGCGLARESHSWFVRIVAPIVGWLFAVILHAVWNGMGILITIAIIEFGLSPVCEAVGLGERMIAYCGFFTLYILFEIPIFLVFLAFAFWTMRRQRRILDEMLAIDIARGLLTREDLDRTCTFFRSLFWIWGGMFKGKFMARYYYTRAVSKLGLSYWHIQRAQKAQGHTASFQQNPLLRDDVLRWRAKI